MAETAQQVSSHRTEEAAAMLLTSIFGTIDGIQKPGATETKENSALGPTPRDDQSFGLSADLLQKPRGSHGAWLVVGPLANIRVTPERGKKVRIALKNNGEIASLNLSKMQLTLETRDQLCRWAEDPNGDRAFAAINTCAVADPSSYKAREAYEIDVKIFIIGSLIRFRIELEHNGKPLVLHTVEFHTHNSGRKEYVSFVDVPPHTPSVKISSNTLKKSGQATEQHLPSVEAASSLLAMAPSFGALGISLSVADSLNAPGSPPHSTTPPPTQQQLQGLQASLFKLKDQNDAAKTLSGFDLFSKRLNLPPTLNQTIKLPPAVVHPSPKRPASPQGSISSVPEAQRVPIVPTISPLPTVVDPISPDSTFSIELQQKPRGSGGAWIAITSRANVRVTPERGKKVRIIGKAFNTRLDWTKLQVLLLEKHGEHWVSSLTSHGFAVTGKRVAADTSTLSSSGSPGATVQICQIDLKLFLLGKRIAFRVDVPGANGIHSAMTAEIYTHNSGRREGAPTPRSGKGSKSQGGDEEDEEGLIENPSAVPKPKPKPVDFNPSNLLVPSSSQLPPTVNPLAQQQPAVANAQADYLSMLAASNPYLSYSMSPMMMMPDYRQAAMMQMMNPMYGAGAFYPQMLFPTAQSQMLGAQAPNGVAQAPVPNSVLMDPYLQMYSMPMLGGMQQPTALASMGLPNTMKQSSTLIVGSPPPLSTGSLATTTTTTVTTTPPSPVKTKSESVSSETSVSETLSSFSAAGPSNSALHDSSSGEASSEPGSPRTTTTVSTKTRGRRNTQPNAVESMPALSSEPPVTSVTVQLFHKPRGSHGDWIPIKSEDQIRVSGGSGKKLRLSFNSPVAIQWPRVQVSVVENGFVIATSKGFRVLSCGSLLHIVGTTPVTTYQCQAEVKVFVVGKTVALRAELPLVEGGAAPFATTVDIRTHNCGSLDKNKKRKRADKELSGESDEDSAESLPQPKKPATAPPTAIAPTSLNGGAQPSVLQLPLSLPGLLQPQNSSFLTDPNFAAGSVAFSPKAWSAFTPSSSTSPTNEPSTSDSSEAMVP